MRALWCVCVSMYVCVCKYLCRCACDIHVCLCYACACVLLHTRRACVCMRRRLRERARLLRMCVAREPLREHGHHRANAHLRTSAHLRTCTLAVLACPSHVWLHVRDCMDVSLICPRAGRLVYARFRVCACAPVRVGSGSERSSVACSSLLQVIAHCALRTPRWLVTRAHARDSMGIAPRMCDGLCACIFARKFMISRELV